MNSSIILVKNDSEVYVSSKFIYSVDVYKIWKKRAYLLSSAFYACVKPLDIKKLTLQVKKKGYILQRFVELKGAPKEYLISKNYKVKKL